MQLRFGQLEKHLKSYTACSQQGLEVKIEKKLFGARKVVFLICQLGRPIAIALWAVGKAPEKLTACVSTGSGGENKKNNNFSEPEKLFFLICQLGGSPIAIALWAAGKAPEKLTACSQECLEVKIKNNFSEPEKLFFNLPVRRVSLCNCALVQLEKHLKSSLPALNRVWR